jgi:hypothetical protein
MSTYVEPSSPVAEAPRPRRSRTPRRVKDPAAGPAPDPAPKSRDAGKTKVSVYLDADVARKLAVASILRQVDQSDVANRILAEALSPVVAFEKPKATRPSAEALPVSEIDRDPAA